MNKYDDIINIDYKMKHKRMSIKNRSAQFAPFSALTGYKELIIEKGRLTERKIELAPDDKEVLDMKLNIISKELNNKPLITITYFIKDLKKDGGKYEIVTGYLKKIDFTKHFITLSNNLKIKTEDILEIDSQDIRFNDII